MYEIETTGEFDAWLGGISDGKTQKVIVKRIRTMSLGTLGKIRSLDGGLFEAKIDYGRVQAVFCQQREKNNCPALRWR